MGIQAAEIALAAIRAVKGEEELLEHALSDGTALIMSPLPLGDKERIRRAAEAASFGLGSTEVDGSKVQGFIAEGAKSGSRLSVLFDAKDMDRSGSREVRKDARSDVPMMIGSPQPVNQDAVVKALLDVPTAIDGNLQTTQSGKAVGFENLVGSISAAITGSAHHEVRRGQAGSMVEQGASRFPKQKMPLAGGMP